MTDYASRLSIPLDGNPDLELFSKSGVLIANGYDRVVLGGRGPYVEFTSKQMVQERLCETDTEHWYYVELRTVPDDVKVYFQVRPVDYADYVPGKCYISSFDLYDASGQVLIAPLRA